ncbi:GGDEF domain-containing protein [Salinimonas chungwhensis]|uniref:GGDEF domain-containing protein n=1 Tax=Salinimonas chungwhensis TaxID=265425 RepID=UPI00037BDDD9|nr:GGDEF domain-containing protein [Salinimonas chungwhensis]
MEDITLIFIQIAMLGVFTLAAIIFTYALPTPSHPQKALSGYYARLFLLFLWVGFVFLCMRALSFNTLHVTGCSVIFTLAGYMVLMTVIKRHGQQLSKGQLTGIVAHLVWVQMWSLVVYLNDISRPVIDAMLALNAAVPLLASAFLQKRLMDQRNAGDRLLSRLLLLCCLAVVACFPLYLVSSEVSELRKIFYMFGFIVLLMLNIMLGLVASVVHSLVVRLQEQVYSDSLTKCHNRKYLQDYSNNFSNIMQQSGEKVCVVLSDIDRFKHINDTFGHLAGDKALRHFTSQLRAELKNDDVLVRLGGEEFVIILPGCDLGDAVALAERLRLNILHNPLLTESETVALSASFGVAAVHQDYDIFAAISRADAALYEAKFSGRNQVKVKQTPYFTVSSTSMAFQ